MRLELGDVAGTARRKGMSFASMQRRAVGNKHIGPYLKEAMEHGKHSEFDFR